MKKIFLLPSLFFGILTQAQFNTAAYKYKLQSVDIAMNENQNIGNSFINYKNTFKEKSEKEVVENTLENTVENNRKIIYKKIEPIEITERQLVYMPLSTMNVTSNYGVRFHPIDKVYKEHNGIDLRANNSFVYSVLDGVVIDSGYSYSNGNYIIIRHEDFETLYLHLDRFYNIRNDIVSAGDIIGVSGSTGKSTGEHLHFAVKENGYYINPITFLNNLIQTNNTIIDYERD